MSTIQPGAANRRPLARLLAAFTGIGLLLAVAACGAGTVDPDVSTAATAVPSRPPSSAAESAVPPGPSPSQATDRPFPRGEFTVTPVAESDPVRGNRDAADDAAIWIHPEDATRSIVIGTDKQEGGGLQLYDLDGREIGALRGGRLNNVDLRGNVVVAGNRSSNTVEVYRLDPESLELRLATAETIEPDLEVYGSCLYQSAENGALYVFVTSEDGEVEQWELVETGAGFHGRQQRAWALDSQVEACVADDPAGAVYVGEEATGIWRFDAEPESPVNGELIATTEDGPLEADVEGLAIAAYADGSGFLIASSQGDNEFVIFDRRTHAHLATFSIEEANGIDEVSNTDGIAVTTAPLGPAFPGGIFVAQDGNNEGQNQNFKFVSLDDILR